MNLEYVPPTEMGKQRQAWFKEHYQPGITLGEAIQLNDEALHLFPVTDEERRLKVECSKNIPEFEL